MKSVLPGLDWRYIVKKRMRDVSLRIRFVDQISRTIRQYRRFSEGRTLYRGRSACTEAKKPLLTRNTRYDLPMSRAYVCTCQLDENVNSHDLWTKRFLKSNEWLKFRTKRTMRKRKASRSENDSRDPHLNREKRSRVKLSPTMTNLKSRRRERDGRNPLLNVGFVPQRDCQP